MTTTTSQTSSMYKKYPAYRRSDAGWVDEVPDPWVMKRMRFLFQLLSGNGFPEDMQGRGEGEFPFFKVSDINGDGLYLEISNNYVSAEDVREKKWNVIPRGSIITAKIGAALSLNHRKLTTHDSLIDNNMLALVPQPNHCILMYAYYLFRVIDLAWFVNPGAVPSVNMRQLRDLAIPLPDHAQQQAIVDFLDRKTALIDDVIAKKQKLIELLKEKRQALITQTVTKGLDPNAKLKPSGIEWLGDIPEGWEVSPLRSFARPGHKTFVDGDWIEAPFIRDEGVRLIQTGNIGIGEYREQGFRYIDEETFRLFDCTEVKPSDVLICRLADPVGRACIAPALGVKMITSVDVCILKPKAECDTRFLIYVLSSSPYLEYMATICRGSTRDRISRSMLGSFRIQEPSVTEQRAIADFLDHETAAIDGVAAKVESQMKLLKEYRQALITSAVTGKIDVSRTEAHVEQ